MSMTLNKIFSCFLDLFRTEARQMDIYNFQPFTFPSITKVEKLYNSTELEMLSKRVFSCINIYNNIIIKSCFKIFSVKSSGQKKSLSPRSLIALILVDLDIDQFITSNLNKKKYSSQEIRKN